MPKTATKPFTHSHVILNDGAVGFKCSKNSEQWPWLALHPFDPIVVQTINFWASVETSAARGTFDPEKWSALTQTEWTCGARDVGHATHGIADTTGDEDAQRYRLTFFDAGGALVYRMTGKGVVFRNRNFETWRKKAKEETAAPPATNDFQYAPADAVGVATQAESFLSPLAGGDTPSARGLVTKENGFPPAHPYQSGSGDHVNSGHLADVARQFATLLNGGSPLTITGGEMTFKRYVELDRPFDVALAQDGQSEDAISMTIDQADHQCAAVKLSFASN